MQIGQKYGNGFGSSPSVPVLIEIPNFMIEIWKIVRHHVLVPRPDSGHPIAYGRVVKICECGFICLSAFWTVIISFLSNLNLTK